MPKRLHREELLAANVLANENPATVGSARLAASARALLGHIVCLNHEISSLRDAHRIAVNAARAARIEAAAKVEALQDEADRLRGRLARLETRPTTRGVDDAGATP
jgi:ubiquinone biosynthesis protein UbiJ